MEEKWKIYEVPSLIENRIDLLTSKKEGKIELKYFIPKYVLCGKYQKELPIKLSDYGAHLDISYIRSLWNSSKIKREYIINISSFVKWNQETFEVLGLLQAEMGKTNNGCINFGNHEYRIINKAISWFEKELKVEISKWRWYIKVNVNDPENPEYKQKIEEKIINYWLKQTKIKKENSHPKIISYTKNTKNKELKFYDRGTLIIEYKNNVLSQIIKKLVYEMSYNIPLLEEKEINHFMKGIFAGEGSIECRNLSKHYRVHLTANTLKERENYQRCLNKLKIRIFLYENYKEMIISKKENHLKLLKLRLLTLSPEKYHKFLYMLEQYDSFPEVKSYKQQFKNKIWNKTPEEKINRILEIHKNNPKFSCQKIADIVEVSKIKVNRVLRENNLGKRLKIHPEDFRQKVALFAKENPNLTKVEIAKHFNIHEAVVRRAIKRYINNTPLKNFDLMEEELEAEVKDKKLIIEED